MLKVAVALSALLGSLANVACAQTPGAHIVIEAPTPRDPEAAQMIAALVTERMNSVGRNDTEVVVRPNHSVVIHSDTLTVEEIVHRLTANDLLSFHLVTGDADAQMSVVPSGSMLAQPFPGGDVSGPELVETTPIMTSEHVERIDPSADPETNEFVVAFKLNAMGTQVFCTVTREHIGERFAILIDGRVVTAPRINEPICGGNGVISGGFDARGANELALALGAALWVPPARIISQGVGVPP